MKVISSLVGLLILFPSLSQAADPISEAMCRDALSFQSCYGASQTQCLEWADISVQKCLAEMPPRPVAPSSIHQLPNSGFARWNLLLGHCAEEKFEAEHLSALVSNAQCAQILSQRLANRAHDTQLPSAAQNKHVSNWKRLLGAVAMPIFFAVTAILIFFGWRSQMMRVSVLFGFLGWLVFLAAGFVGEAISHVLFPELYASIGDNPSQVAGYIFTVLASFILCPMVWAFFRYRKEKSAV